MRLSKPSSSTLIAILALVFAMAGTGLAARSYVITSSSQVKDGAITGADVRSGSLTGSNIKDRSLQPADFNGSVQGPKGDTGATGPRGEAGPAGPAGAEGEPGLSPVTFFAQVDADGTLGASWGVTGVGHAPGNGTYDVGFDEPVTDCAVIAGNTYSETAPNAPPANIEAMIRTDWPYTGRTVQVYTRYAWGDSGQERAFHIAVVC